ncbi:helix-turn-helix domain-containing protein [Bordetella hinzii]|uniref:helix-turn-helix domain-containing protein n=1 Tax=Bordetella hinzii TaxID=103855 RepID=UPI00045B33A4|nr:helix-turn-helix transcriptional regulator [Bordetella hinzii]KCB47960.1 DNA-binding helix-turn-helix protein [Bordetella hinzii 4161]KXA74437.1 DNA-binding protein [Bordetella hinzii LMG 13501]QDJ35717.1 transcriptional regulator [Bordetella hinzii]VEH32050.1 DNA-binding protein [Bordetella hinzii]
MLYGQRYEAVRRELQQVRLDAGLTQTELANRLGKSQSYVSKVERGEQYIDLIEFMAWCESCKAEPEKIVKKI